MFYSTPDIDSLSFVFLMSPRPPTSTLFPYTTLFRSVRHVADFAPAHCNACPLGNAKLAGSNFAFPRDRKSTRLNSSHGYISYAVFCLKKKTHFSHSRICSARLTQISMHPRTIPLPSM